MKLEEFLRISLSSYATKKLINVEEITGCKLAVWGNILLGKILAAQLVKNFPALKRNINILVLNTIIFLVHASVRVG
jgi:hypothetical protein